VPAGSVSSEASPLGLLMADPFLCLSLSLILVILFLPKTMIDLKVFIVNFNLIFKKYLVSI
jgi:hypothetical protein